MKQKESKLYGKNYIRISKRRARALVISGHTVFVVPCNLNLNTKWFSPGVLDKRFLDHTETPFDTFINEFAYYNCNAEMGYYPSYYVVSDDE